MSAVLEQLNLELGDVVDKVRRSLVQVHNGRRGAGSGAIWHRDGLIVTNAHVVSGRGHRHGPHGPRSDLRVTLPDGATLPARLLARDEGRDVAALLVQAKELTPMELGNVPRSSARPVGTGGGLSLGCGWCGHRGNRDRHGGRPARDPPTGPGVDRRQSRTEARSLGRTVGGRPGPVGGSQHHDGRPRGGHGGAGSRGQGVPAAGAGVGGSRALEMNSYGTIPMSSQ